jgi:hypothetical protein
VCLGQTDLKKNSKWCIDSTQAVEVSRVLALHPVQQEKIQHLEQLLSHKDELYKAEKDSLQLLITRKEKAVKKAKGWGNAKALGVGVGIILIKIFL